ncbi:MAG: SDR family NAD(P)-dependent oxidoreductase [Gemmatimonadales bacterium]|nr:SDR family NAD(P)-dependent oxidoreductase [Gemmatimonadales bacterium]NIN13075.1 SDR family NAD(P)-dependent oxidoreductase [Gemmatimonadales bacterium]NIN51159.1 SDR family NAD(P)-dependent oxidoreductase [Gemmatimonadales bacterium]NIP08623.1 SDR family NAD(P)-dependent oxidoreductase [Gemmatimonadales bacterium]NIR02311.1 SDR family NAD(P)-dependent oxidoreductase [Gemmatimonadales bacterium]
MTALADKVALVTGASRGIGRVIADRLEDAGAQVIGLARSFTERSAGPRLEIRCDVTREDDIQRAVERMLHEVRAPDIVVNNAGAFLLKPLSDTSKSEFEEQLRVNLVGPFLVLRALLPHLARSGDTHLVTIGSVVDHRPYPENVAYGASKYGVRGLHEVLAEELRGSGIRLTLVSPGPTDTKLWDSLDPDGRDDLPSRSTMLLPTDVADAVLYAVTRPPHVNVDWIRLMPVG